MMQETWLFTLLALVGSVLWSPNAAWPELSAPKPFKTLGKGRPTAAALSPDRTQLAVGTDDEIFLYDTQTGAEVARVPARYIGSLVYSPDGSILASKSAYALYEDYEDESKVRLRDTSNGQLIAEFDVDPSISQMNFSPDGTILGIRYGGAQSNKKIGLWNIPSAQQKPAPVLSGSAFAFSPDGVTLAVAAVGGPWGTMFFLWNMNNWELSTFEGGRERPYIMEFSPDGTTLAVATNPNRPADPSNRSSVTLYDVASGRIKDALKFPDHRVLSLSFSPDGLRLAGKRRGPGSSVWVWDTESDSAWVWDTESDEVKHILGLDDWAWFRPGALFLNSNVGFWDVDSGKEKIIHRTEHQTAIAFSHDGSIFAAAEATWYDESGRGAMSVKLWDTHSWQLKTTLSVPVSSWINERGIPISSWINELAFSYDGTTLTARQHLVGAWLWDTATGEIKTTLEDSGEHGYWERQFRALSPDGAFVLVDDSETETLELWDMDKGELKITFKGDNLTWNSALHDSKLAYGRDETVMLWNFLNGQFIDTIERERKTYYGYVGPMSFSPNGETLVCSYGDNLVFLWDATPGGHTRHKATFFGHSDHTPDNVPAGLSSLKFSPDGSILAGGGYGPDWRGKIWFWDVAGEGTMKNHIATIDTYGRTVSALEFSPDNATLASRGSNGVTLLWDTSLNNIPTVTEEGIAATPGLPTRTVLLANYPNPFNSTTQILYRLAAPGPVRLVIYNTLGQPVRTLVDEFQAIGRYQVQWDCRDRYGSAVAAGVYVARLLSPGGVQTRRMLYLK